MYNLQNYLCQKCEERVVFNFEWGVGSLINLFIQDNRVMSLFVGNISKKVSKKQFQDTFKEYGRCRIDLRVNNQSSDIQYAFVQFDNDRDAEKAKTDLHNVDLSGLKLNIEWSKNSGRFGENRNRRGNDRGGDRGRGGGRDWNDGRGRRDDRDRSWDRRKPRSNSRDRRRDSPNYAQDLQTPPTCKRDIILLQKLTQREIKESKNEAKQQIGEISKEHLQKDRVEMEVEN